MADHYKTGFIVLEQNGLTLFIFFFSLYYAKNIFLLILLNCNLFMNTGCISRSFNQFRKHQASQFTEDPHEPIAILPSTYSVHDFHSFGIQGSGITPSLHFHLAGSINADTGKFIYLNVKY